MTTNPFLKQAVEDIQLIKSMVHESGEMRDPALRCKVNLLNVQLHRIALLGSIIVLIPEMAGGLVTRAIMASANIPDLKTYGLFNILYVLILICTFIYVEVHSFVSKNSESKVYVKSYFSYLANYRFATDLLIKFIPVVFILAIGRPEYLSSLFVLYIAEYLFQGRFFRLSRNKSILLGATCLLIAISMAVEGCAEILIPALLFFSITLLSLCCLKAEYIELKERA